MGIFDNLSYKDAMELRSFMQVQGPLTMAVQQQQQQPQPQQQQKQQRLQLPKQQQH